MAKVPVGEVNFHNIDADTTRITGILLETQDITDPNKRVLTIAEKFLDVPYVAKTLETDNGVEVLTVNLDELDCTTFVETVLALALTAGEHRTSWRDYVANLEGMRYRGGVLNGYPSRLHYISDWVVDNSHRGNVTEVTCAFPDHRSTNKTLDFMSKHRENYPAMADSANFAGVKNIEMGYRMHRYDYLPWNVLNNKGIKEKFIEGDMVALLSKANGLDVAHVGFVVKDTKGTPYLLHASLKEGKVVRDKTPLMDYLKKAGMPGLRVIRLKD